MPPLGTAPRRVAPGVWRTRSGRTLSPAGAAYWETALREGRTDGHGHMTTPPAVLKPQGQFGRGRRPQQPQQPNSDRQAALAAQRNARRTGTVKPLSAARARQVAKRPTKIEDVYSARFKAAGYEKGLLDKIAAPFARPIGQIGESMYYLPAGLFETGRAVVKDTGEAIHGKPSFKRTRNLGKAIAKATAEDFRHPLRRSGYLALDLAGAVSAGAGTAARVSAAGRAAAETGRVGAVARALAHAPEPRPRTLRSGELEAHPLESRNKALAAAQRAHDKVVNKAAARNPEGRIGRKYLPKKIGKTLAEERRLVTEPAAKAEAGALAKTGKKFSDAEQHALRIVAEQKKGKAKRPVTLAERKAFHLAQGDKASAKLTELADRYVYDTPEGPKIRPEYPQLQQAYSRLAKVARNRDELLTAIGRLTEEGAAERVSGPAQVIAGAEYEQPAPGKLGRPSQSLIARRQRVERLQALFDRSLARSQARNAKTRPATRAEAQTRLAELEDAHEKLVDAAAAQLKGDVPFDRAETARRNLERVRAQRRARGRAVEGRTATNGRGPKTQAQELRELAQERLDQLAEQNPGEPWAKAYLAQRDEIARLRTAINESAPVLGEGGAQDFGRTAKYPRRSVYDPTTTRLGGALSVAKDELASREAAAARRVKPTGLVGAEDLKGAGDVRIPYAKRPAVKSLFRPQGAGRGKAIGGVRNPASLTHSFTGALLRKGGGRRDVTRLVAESNVEAQRLGEALRVRDQLRKAAVPHPPEKGAEDFVAIRLDNPKANLSPRVRALVDEATRKAESGIKLSRAERNALRGQADETRRLFIYGSPEDIGKLSPAEQEQFSKLYEAGQIGWVNRRLLGGLDKPQQLTGPGVHAVTDVVDAVNNVTRAAVLYLKPAYAAPNLLGNLALNIVQQGFAAPVNLARAAKINAKLSPEAAAKLDGTMQEGFVRAISGEGGVGRAVIDAAANVWSKGVDLPFRRAAFLYEARRHLRDYGPRADWRKIENLLTDPSRADELAGVVRRANKEIIDYGRLGPAEREIVRRLIFFYPWVRGSTVYAGRFMVEHPIKAAAAAKVGEQGKQFADETLGPVPSRYEGAFKAAGGMVNPASAAILGTPAQVEQATEGLLRGNVKQAAKLAEFASPAVSLGAAEISRIDPSTGFPYPARASALDIAKDQLISGTPQASLVRNLKGDYGKVLQPTKAQAIGKFAVGGLVPQRYDPEALAKAAEAEQRSLMSPGQRVARDGMRLRKEFLASAKQAGLLPPDATKLPDELRDAITARTARYANYASRGIKRGDPDYQRKAFEADMQLLEKRAVLTPRQAARGLEWARDASREDLISAREALGRKQFKGDALSDYKADVTEAAFVAGLKAAGAHGKLSAEQVQRGLEWARDASLRDLRSAIEHLRSDFGLDVKTPDLR